MYLFLVVRRQTRATLTDTLLPSATLFRSRYERDGSDRAAVRQGDDAGADRRFGDRRHGLGRRYDDRVKDGSVRERIAHEDRVVAFRAARYQRHGAVDHLLYTADIFYRGRRKWIGRAHV